MWGHCERAQGGVGDEVFHPLPWPTTPGMEFQAALEVGDGEHSWPQWRRVGGDRDDVPLSKSDLNLHVCMCVYVVHAHLFTIYNLLFAYLQYTNSLLHMSSFTRVLLTSPALQYAAPVGHPARLPNAHYCRPPPPRTELSSSETDTGGTDAAAHSGGDDHGAAPGGGGGGAAGCGGRRNRWNFSAVLGDSTFQLTIALTVENFYQAAAASVDNVYITGHCSI